MPAIEPFKFSSKETAGDDMAMQIMAYMLFPNDDREREGYISKHAGINRDIMRNATRERVAKDLTEWGDEQAAITLQSVSDENFRVLQRDLMERASLHQDEFGGTTTVSVLPYAEKLQDDIGHAFLNCLRVGVLFRLMADLSVYYGERISMEKIFPIFIKHPSFRSLRCQGQNHKQYTHKMLRDLWEEYRNVAHFCAALFFLAVKNHRHCAAWQMIGIEPFSADHRYLLIAQFFSHARLLANLSTPSAFISHIEVNTALQQRLATPPSPPAFAFLYRCYRTLLLSHIPPIRFLGLAREYQRFGLTYKAKQSHFSLLDDRIWQIPENWDLPTGSLPYAIPHPSMREIYERHAMRKVRA